MMKTVIILGMAAFTLTAHAQVPDAINYQAVARDAAGNLIANQDIEIMFRIYDVPTGGTEVFAEEHASVPTNQFGLFSVQIGTGSVITGSLGSIDWSTASKWLEVTVEGTVIASRSQLVAVPYALLAKRAEIDAVDDADANPTNELQTLSINGNQLSIASGNTVSLPTAPTYTQGTGISIAGTVISNTGDLSNTNELQTLGLNGNQLSISSGNSVTLPAPSGWNLTGNSGTGPTNFIGTTDAQPLRFRMNNVLAGHVGYYTTALGLYAAPSNTAQYNTAIGAYSMYQNTTGNNNTAVGYDALGQNVMGNDNTAVGDNALGANYSGIDNTAVGLSAMYYNDVGRYNAALGKYAFFYNNSGYYGTAIGMYALFNNTYGDRNTAIGYAALYNNVTGEDNIAVGYGAGTSSSLQNTISIGNYGYANGWHNQVFIGNLSTGWNGGNTPWYTYSDARVKTRVTEDVAGLDFITRLRPVTYYRDIDAQAELTGNEPTPDFPEKYDIERIKFSGFLAQEVEQAANASGYDFSGVTVPRNDKEVYTLSYEQFVVPLVKAVQELAAENEELRLMIENLQSQVNGLR